MECQKRGASLSDDDNDDDEEGSKGEDVDLAILQSAPRSHVDPVMVSDRAVPIARQVSRLRMVLLESELLHCC